MMSHKTEAFSAMAHSIIENLKKEIWKDTFLKQALNV